jgi:hypothetical protein
MMQTGEIKIPDSFWSVPYNGAHYPGSAGVEGLKGGANCQQFAYELLRHNGFVMGDLRSSELWADTTDTVLVAGDPAPGDLLLFNRARQPWGAHVAVYLGRDQATHLARHIGKPTIWALSEFTAPLYAILLEQSARSAGGIGVPECRRDHLAELALLTPFCFSGSLRLRSGDAPLHLPVTPRLSRCMDDTPRSRTTPSAATTPMPRPGPGRPQSRWCRRRCRSPASRRRRG